MDNGETHDDQGARSRHRPRPCCRRLHPRSTDAREQTSGRQARRTCRARSVRWLYFSDERLRMAVFVSKTSHCLYDIMSRVQAGEWQVDVPLIVSNHPDAEPIAKSFNTPFRHFPVLGDTRAEQERLQIELLQEQRIDLVVLARYMVIVGAPFIQAFPQRMINIHHAFLPAFIGAKPYHRAYERGVKLIGATAHYVTEDLDEGPIIEQDVNRVSHLDSIDELTRKGFDVEKITLARAIRRHLERKTLVFGNRVIVFD